MTLAERWNGTSWTMQDPQPGRRQGQRPQRGVMHVNGTACTAAGEYKNSAGIFDLAERWNGTSWTIRPTPNPGGAKASPLIGVRARQHRLHRRRSYQDSGGTK